MISPHKTKSKAKQNHSLFRSALSRIPAMKTVKEMEFKQLKVHDFGSIPTHTCSLKSYRVF